MNTPIKELTFNQWSKLASIKLVAFLIVVDAAIGMLYAGLVSIKFAMVENNNGMLISIALVGISMIWGLPGMAKWIEQTICRKLGIQGNN